jgi:hypothetical protein
MQMKKTVGMVMLLALAAGWALDVSAEKKNEPRSRFVKETVEALGGEHYPEGMSVKSIDSIEIGETYYHIFQGKVSSDEYHVIIFDNYDNYLGFYKSPYIVSNYEKEGCAVLETGDIDDYGNPLRYYIPLEKGPPPIIVLGAKQISFTKGPEVAATEEGVEGEEGAEGTAADNAVKPEYREWNITMKGKAYKVPALYISQTFATVTLKGEATGNEKEFPISSLSDEDREYIQQFK